MTPKLFLRPLDIRSQSKRQQYAPGRQQTEQKWYVAFDWQFFLAPFFNLFELSKICKKLKFHYAWLQGK
jgi:hypothetical protein